MTSGVLIVPFLISFPEKSFLWACSARVSYFHPVSSPVVTDESSFSAVKLRKAEVTQLSSAYWLCKSELEQEGPSDLDKFYPVWRKWK